MTTEIRYILFSREELNAAVSKWLCKRHPKFDPSQIHTTEIRQVGDGTVTGCVLTQINGSTRRIQLDPADLLSAILLFCRQQRIPLPVRAVKRMDLANGGAALVATLGAEAAALEAVSGPLRMPVPVRPA